MTDEQLDLVETMDLTRAIERRCKAFLLVCEWAVNDSAENASDRTLSYSGGWSSALGLAEYGRYRLARAPDSPLTDDEVPSGRR